MIDTVRYIGEYALKGRSIYEEDVQLESLIQDPASTPDYITPAIISAKVITRFSSAVTTAPPNK